MFGLDWNKNTQAVSLSQPAHIILSSKSVGRQAGIKEPQTNHNRKTISLHKPFFIIKTWKNLKFHLNISSIRWTFLANFMAVLWFIQFLAIFSPVSGLISNIMARILSISLFTVVDYYGTLCFLSTFTKKKTNEVTLRDLGPHSTSPCLELAAHQNYL